MDTASLGRLCDPADLEHTLGSLSGKVLQDPWTPLEAFSRRDLEVNSHWQSAMAHSFAYAEMNACR